MLIIKCSGEEAFGGRTEDIFVLEDYDNLDQLHEFITSNQPVKCKEPTAFYKWNIIAEEEMRDRLVYLNNYLKIRPVYYYVMGKDERTKIYENQCNQCKFGDGSLSSALRCSFLMDGTGECKNFSESITFSFKKWLKSKFKP